MIRRPWGWLAEHPWVTSLVLVVVVTASAAAVLAREDTRQDAFVACVAAWADETTDRGRALAGARAEVDAANDDLWRTLARLLANSTPDGRAELLDHLNTYVEASDSYRANLKEHPQPAPPRLRCDPRQEPTTMPLAAAQTSVTLDDYWLTFLVSVALPMLTAVIRRRYSASWIASLVLLLLAMISGWLTSLYATGGTFELRAAAVSVAVSFITAVGVHYGLLKPTGITGNDGVISRALPAGVGSPVAGPLPLQEEDHTFVGERTWPPAS